MTHKIRILSYNIHKGLSPFGVRFVLSQMRDAIRTTNADIVFLQEVVGHHRLQPIIRPQWPSESQFEYLADKIWPHFAYGKNAVSRIGNHGNAILSKYPIHFFENLDISTNALESRGLLHAVITPYSDSPPIHLFNVHLDLLHRGRSRQAIHIVKRISSHVPPDSPFILAGDFNDWSQKMSNLIVHETGLKEAYSAYHGSYAKTFPSFYPVLSLDRVYFRNCSITGAQHLRESPWRDLSDHLPLLIEISYPKLS
jgi:endonuclease/exonuclease/phosphatase family metal-dependent hydrolase